MQWYIIDTLLFYMFTPINNAYATPCIVMIMAALAHHNQSMSEYIIPIS